MFTLRKGKSFLLFLLFPVLFFLPFLLPGGEKSIPEKDTLEKLPPVLAGFRKGGIQKSARKAKIFYRAPSGLFFRICCGPSGKKILSDDPDTGENRKITEEIFAQHLKKLQHDSRSRKTGLTIVFEKPCSFPGLAGRSLKGIWRQYLFSGKKGMKFRADHFVAFYRGNVMQVDFLCADHFLKKTAHDQIFEYILASVSSMLYEGEKITVQPELKKLISAYFEKLLSDPLSAAKEAHALIAFVTNSPLVIVKVNDEDIVWQKSLSRGTSKEQKYGLLLFSAYMAGNAEAQLRKGICADTRNAGIQAMKKVYRKIKGKDPSFFVPELDK